MALSKSYAFDGLNREEALAYYNMLCEDQPNLPAAHFNKALTLEKLNRSTEAYVSYTAALRGWKATVDKRKAGKNCLWFEPDYGLLLLFLEPIRCYTKRFWRLCALLILY